MELEKQSYEIEAKATPGLSSPEHHPDSGSHTDYFRPGSLHDLDHLRGKGGYSEEIVVKYDIKRLSSWFHTWKTWQKRLLICSVMNCCTKQQLMMLATSMEPLLHMDFCSTLLPPFQSLHLDGIAVFHNTRIITHRCTEPEIIPKIDSQAYLNSLPSTFLSKSSASSIPPPSSSHLHQKDQASPNMPFVSPKKDKKNQIKREPILPALPLTHPEHLPGPNREPSFQQLIGQRRQRFSSVPDFHSTMSLLKNSRKRWNEGSKRRKAHMKRKTISTYFTQPLKLDHRAEEFKGQLAQVTKWMVSWEEVYKSHLLSELVKLCDKDLLGYFVQCLHQQLASTLGINSLPDSCLNKIFQYLSPNELCTVSQVCKNWNLQANDAALWKRHTYMLGMDEGVGNISEVMEAVIDHYKHSPSHASADDPSKVDWKRVYRDFDKLLDSMKDLVIRTADSAGSSDIEERLKSAARCHTARNKLSLLEMLDILRLKTSKPNVTTNELYKMAPESASATRHRMRAEKKKEEFEKLETIISQELESSTTKIKKEKSPNLFAHIGAWTPTHNLEFARNLMLSIRQTDPEYCKFLQQLNLNLNTAEEKQTAEISEEFIDRLEIAQEVRPKAPHWPNPNALMCLVLAGALVHRTVRPGQIVDIPKLRRLENVLSITLCMQCDSRKIIIGNLNRTITVIDIRTGRPVTMLHGHKGSVQCLQYDDYKIVSGSWDTTCIVWDIVHFKMLKQLNGHSECVSCLNFDTDILVSGSYDGSLRVWNTSNWDTHCIMSSAHPGGVLCLKLDRKLIASGGIDHEVKIWSASSFHCLKVLSHAAPVTALAMSYLLLISCSIDGAVVVWDINSYKSMMRLRAINGAHIRQLAQFNTKFYGAGSDGVVYELDISTGTCLRTLKGHNMIITAICVVDHKLVSTSADKTIVTWHFQKPVTSKTKEKIHCVKMFVEKSIDRDEDITSSSSLTNEDEVFPYQTPKFYADFHMRHVVGTGPNCCGFVYEH